MLLSAVQVALPRKGDKVRSMDNEDEEEAEDDAAEDGADEGITWPTCLDPFLLQHHSTAPRRFWSKSS